MGAGPASAMKLISDSYAEKIGLVRGWCGAGAAMKLISDSYAEKIGLVSGSVRLPRCSVGDRYGSGLVRGWSPIASRHRAAARRTWCFRRRRVLWWSSPALERRCLFIKLLSESSETLEKAAGWCHLLALPPCRRRVCRVHSLKSTYRGLSARSKCRPACSSLCLHYLSQGGGLREEVATGPSGSSGPAVGLPDRSHGHRLVACPGACHV